MAVNASNGFYSGKGSVKMPKIDLSASNIEEEAGRYLTTYKDKTTGKVVLSKFFSLPEDRSNYTTSIYEILKNEDGSTTDVTYFDLNHDDIADRIDKTTISADKKTKFLETDLRAVDENGSIFDGADGIVDYTYKYVYNDDGKEICFEHDKDADGVPETTTTTKYDKKGNIVDQIKFDRETQTTTYYAKSTRNVFDMIKYVEYDIQGDGKVDYKIIYDIFGNQVQYEF